MCSLPFVLHMLLIFEFVINRSYEAPAKCCHCLRLWIPGLFADHTK